MTPAVRKSVKFPTCVAPLAADGEAKIQRRIDRAPPPLLMARNACAHWQVILSGLVVGPWITVAGRVD